MIKDRRVVLRMNLSQFSREIKQNVLVKMCIFVFRSLKHSSLPFFYESPVKDTWYSAFVSVFLGFHCSENGFDQGRVPGSDIGGGGGGGSVTGNFVKDTGSENG